MTLGVIFFLRNENIFFFAVNEKMILFFLSHNFQKKKTKLKKNVLFFLRLCAFWPMYYLYLHTRKNWKNKKNNRSFLNKNTQGKNVDQKQRKKSAGVMGGNHNIFSFPCDFFLHPHTPRKFFFKFYFFLVCTAISFFFVVVALFLKHVLDRGKKGSFASYIRLGWVENDSQSELCDWDY